MKEETNWKKFLTEEVLKEIWHESKITENSSCSCGRPYHLGTPYDHYNRTFDNQSNMMELYKYIYEDNRWKDFFDILWIKYQRCCNTVDVLMIDYLDWLFCLGNEDYESRCKLVAEFYGWKETKAVLERLNGRKQPEDHPDVELVCENDNIPGDFDGVIKIAGLEKSN